MGGSVELFLSDGRIKGTQFYLELSRVPFWQRDAWSLISRIR
jgi:hypothetical protein